MHEVQDIHALNLIDGASYLVRKHLIAAKEFAIRAHDRQTHGRCLHDCMEHSAIEILLDERRVLSESAEFFLNHRRKVGQHPSLRFVKVSGAMVDDAKCAERVAVDTADDMPGIEADIGRAGHQRIVSEPNIGEGVAHDKGTGIR